MKYWRCLWETITKFSAPSRLCVSFVKQPCGFLWRCAPYIARSSPTPVAEETLSEARWRAESTEVIGIHRMNRRLTSKHAAAVPGVQLLSDSPTYQGLKLKSAVGVEVSRGAECSGVIINAFSLFFHDNMRSRKISFF